MIFDYLTKNSTKFAEEKKSTEEKVKTSVNEAYANVTKEINDIQLYEGEIPQQALQTLYNSVLTWHGCYEACIKSRIHLYQISYVESNGEVIGML